MDKLILTIEDIINIQIRQILDSDEEEDRGMEGLVMYEGTLEFIPIALEMPGIKDNPVKMAALVLYKIANGHIFWQGNKRTAFVAADTLLGCYGMYISVETEELVDFIVKVALPDEVTIEDVEKWIENHLEYV
jgi:death-on-curing protein